MPSVFWFVGGTDPETYGDSDDAGQRQCSAEPALLARPEKTTEGISTTKDTKVTKGSHAD